MRKTFILTLGLILLGAPAAFATISIDNSGAPGTVFQQTFSSPCVIGDSSCKQPTINESKNNFDYTQFSTTPDVTWNGKTTALTTSFTPSTGTYDLTSPVPFNGNVINTQTKGKFIDDNGPYIVSTGIGVGGEDTIPSKFTIAIDMNYAKNPETLVFFKTWLSADGGTTWAVNTNYSYIPGTAFTLAAGNNGNGFSDAILTGFDLSAFSGQQVFFEVKWSGDADGMEQFFIVPSGTAAAVPEPISLLLLGTGLIGLVAVRRFKK
jgi:hypothetical protein